MIASLFKKKAVRDGPARIIQIRGDNTSMESNLIKTSKYNLASFIPILLFEQFSRLGNMYFAIVSALQLFTTFSPTNKYSTVLPLVAVIFVSAIREAVEDLQRHKSDHAVNGASVKVLRLDTHTQKLEWKELKSADVKVGDIIMMKANSIVPADCVVLAAGGEGGVVNVDTASLDGESNLKVKSAAADTSALGIEPSDWSRVEGDVRADHPNNKLYVFSGVLEVCIKNPCDLTDASAFTQSLRSSTPLTNDNVVLRGMVQRNTPWSIGLVLYAGHSSKVMLNSKGASTKKANMDRMIDYLVIFIFLILIILCTITAIYSSVWAKKTKADYLPFLETEGDTSFQVWITSLLLFNNLLPISLYVTLELAQFYQAKMINEDPSMIHYIPTEKSVKQLEREMSVKSEISTASDVPDYSVILPKARNSKLNASLGMVGVIVTDKTGTLTQNRMTLRNLSIDGVIMSVSVSPSAEPATPLISKQRISSVTNLLNASRSFLSYRSDAESPVTSQAPPAAALLSDSTIQPDPKNLASIADANSTELSSLSNGKIDLGSSTVVSPPVGSGLLGFRSPSNKIHPLTPDETAELNPSKVLSPSKNLMTIMASNNGLGGTLGGVGSQSMLDFDNDSMGRDSDEAPLGLSADALQGAPEVASALFESSHPNHKHADDLMMIMALCHAVHVAPDSVPTGVPTREYTDTQLAALRYESTSPDEIALVNAARDHGYVLVHRDARSMTLNVHGNERRFEILAVNEFNSVRKRMSVLLKEVSAMGNLRIQGSKRRNPDSRASYNSLLEDTIHEGHESADDEHSGSLPAEDDLKSFLLVKGADSSMLPLLKDIPITETTPGSSVTLNQYAHTHGLHHKASGFGLVSSGVSVQPNPHFTSSTFEVAASQGGSARIAQRASVHFLSPVRDSNDKSRSNSSASTGEGSSNSFSSGMSSAPAPSSPEVLSTSGAPGQEGEAHFPVLSSSTVGSSGTAIVRTSLPNALPLPLQLNLPLTDGLPSRLDGEQALLPPSNSYSFHPQGEIPFENGLRPSSGLTSSLEPPVTPLTPGTPPSLLPQTPLQRLQEHLDTFAASGLRTLVYGSRTCDPALTSELMDRYNRACTDFAGRSEALAAAADFMERDLDLVAASGIEDRLQDGVPETIEKLTAAGVRFVMCTGDKTETALNISLSCNLLDEQCDLVVLKSEDLQTNFDSLMAAKASLIERGLWQPGTINQYLGLVIEGHSLTDLLVSPKRSHPRTGSHSSKRRHHGSESGNEDSDRHQKNHSGRVSGGAGVTGRDRRRRRKISSSRNPLHKVRRAFQRWHASLTASFQKMRDSVISDSASEAHGLSYFMNSARARRHAKPGRSHQSDSKLKPSHEEIRRELLLFMQQCRSVICTRVSPLQKAEIVRLMREGNGAGAGGAASARGRSTRSQVLAVGDGGNDVNMILSADVGVGIAGLEGQQAVMASDFSIGQFRFLQELLLVHGRSNYRRIALAVLYSVYKNVALVLTLWFFTFWNGFSGTTLFESYVGSMWNLIFTSFPILSAACADEDISRTFVLRFPITYKSGPANSEFSLARIAAWLIEAFVHALLSVVLAAGTLLLATNDTRGYDDGLLLSGTALHCFILFVVTYRLVLEIYSWRWHTFLAFGSSFGLWFLFVGVYAVLYRGISATFALEIFGVARELFGRPAFWLGLLLIPLAVNLTSLVPKLLRRWQFPGLTQLVQEWSRGHGSPLQSDHLNELALRFSQLSSRSVSNRDFGDFSASNKQLQLQLQGRSLAHLSVSSSIRSSAPLTQAIGIGAAAHVHSQPGHGHRGDRRKSLIFSSAVAPHDVRGPNLDDIPGFLRKPPLDHSKLMTEAQHAHLVRSMVLLTRHVRSDTKKRENRVAERVRRVQSQLLNQTMSAGSSMLSNSMSMSQHGMLSNVHTRSILPNGIGKMSSRMASGGQANPNFVHASSNGSGGSKQQSVYSPKGPSVFSNPQSSSSNHTSTSQTNSQSVLVSTASNHNMGSHGHGLTVDTGSSLITPSTSKPRLQGLDSTKLTTNTNMCHSLNIPPASSNLNGLSPPQSPTQPPLSSMKLDGSKSIISSLASTFRGLPSVLGRTADTPQQTPRNPPVSTTFLPELPQDPLDPNSNALEVGTARQTMLSRDVGHMDLDLAASGLLITTRERRLSVKFRNFLSSMAHLPKASVLSKALSTDSNDQTYYDDTKPVAASPFHEKSLDKASTRDRERSSASRETQNTHLHIHRGVAGESERSRGDIDVMGEHLEHPHSIADAKKHSRASRDGMESAYDFAGGSFSNANSKFPTPQGSNVSSPTGMSSHAGFSHTSSNLNMSLNMQSMQMNSMIGAGGALDDYDDDDLSSLDSEAEGDGMRSALDGDPTDGESPAPPLRTSRSTRDIQKGQLSSTAYNRFTHKFVDPVREKIFFRNFFLRKSTRLTRLALFVAVIFALAYLLFDISKATTLQLVVRSLLVGGGFGFLILTCFDIFREPSFYSGAMIAALVLAGAAKTIVIDSGGLYGQALYQLCIFLVLRLRFMHTIVVAIIDLTIFIVFTVVYPREAVVLPVFVVYILFISVFGAISSWSLHVAMREDFISESKLYTEEKRGYEMVSSMLPAHVVATLRQLDSSTSAGGGDWAGLVSTKEPCVTIVFIDILDFVGLTATTTPSMLVSLLDRVWALFDSLAEKHAVTKLETVGKEYVACAGLNGDRRDHATACINFSLDVLKALSLLRGVDGKQALQVRIGINTGPVVAGIVGHIRPQFVLVGDTTNVSSRMSSTGLDGCVNISPKTYNRVKHKFSCVPRSVEVKGKGTMTVYYVRGRMRRKSQTSMQGASIRSRGGSMDPLQSSNGTNNNPSHGTHSQISSRLQALSVLHGQHALGAASSNGLSYESMSSNANLSPHTQEAVDSLARQGGIDRSRLVGGILSNINTNSALSTSMSTKDHDESVTDMTSSLELMEGSLIDVAPPLSTTTDKNSPDPLIVSPSGQTLHTTLSQVSMAPGSNASDLESQHASSLAHLSGTPMAGSIVSDLKVSSALSPIRVSASYHEFDTSMRTPPTILPLSATPHPNGPLNLTGGRFSRSKSLSRDSDDNVAQTDRREESPLLDTSTMESVRAPDVPFSVRKLTSNSSFNDSHSSLVGARATLTATDGLPVVEEEHSDQQASIMNMTASASEHVPTDSRNSEGSRGSMEREETKHNRTGLSVNPDLHNSSFSTMLGMKSPMKSPFPPLIAVLPSSSSSATSTSLPKNLLGVEHTAPESPAASAENFSITSSGDPKLVLDALPVVNVLSRPAEASDALADADGSSFDGSSEGEAGFSGVSVHDDYSSQSSTPVSVVQAFVFRQSNTEGVPGEDSLLGGDGRPRDNSVFLAPAVIPAIRDHGSGPHDENDSNLKPSVVIRDNANVSENGGMDASASANASASASPVISSSSSAASPGILKKPLKDNKVPVLPLPVSLTKAQNIVETAQPSAAERDLSPNPSSRVLSGESEDNPDDEEVGVDASDALLRRATERRRLEVTRIAERVQRKTRDVAVSFLTYKFVSPELEDRWRLAVAKTSVSAVRRALLVLCLYSIFRILEISIRYNVTLEEDALHGRPTTSEILLRLVYGGLLLLMYLLTFSDAYTFAIDYARLSESRAAEQALYSSSVHRRGPSAGGSFFARQDSRFSVYTHGRRVSTADSEAFTVMDADPSQGFGSQGNLGTFSGQGVTMATQLSDNESKISWGVGFWDFLWVAIRVYGHVVLLGLGGVVLTFSSPNPRDAMLDLLFFFSVVSNSQTVSFPIATLINILSFSIFLIVATTSTIFDLPPDSYDTDIMPFVMGDAFFLVAALAMCALAQGGIEFYKRHRFAVALLFTSEVSKNHGLLKRMLPAAVVAQLMDGSDTHTAQAFDGVCVMFCDVAGFTKMSSEVSPSELIAMLNLMFAGFEAAAAMNGTFKVQTIGDCFVCIAGIPYKDEVPAAAHEVFMEATKGSRSASRMPLTTLSQKQVSAFPYRFSTRLSVQDLNAQKEIVVTARPYSSALASTRSSLHNVIAENPSDPIQLALANANANANANVSLASNSTKSSQNVLNLANNVTTADNMPGQLIFVPTKQVVMQNSALVQWNASVDSTDQPTVVTSTVASPVPGTMAVGMQAPFTNGTPSIPPFVLSHSRTVSFPSHANSQTHSSSSQGVSLTLASLPQQSLTVSATSTPLIASSAALAAHGQVHSLALPVGVAHSVVSVNGTPGILHFATPSLGGNSAQSMPPLNLEDAAQVPHISPGPLPQQNDPQVPHSNQNTSSINLPSEVVSVTTDTDRSMASVTGVNAQSHYLIAVPNARLTNPAISSSSTTTTGSVATVSATHSGVSFAQTVTPASGSTAVAESLEGSTVVNVHNRSLTAAPVGGSRLAGVHARAFSHLPTERSARFVLPLSSPLSGPGAHPLSVSSSGAGSGPGSHGLNVNRMMHRQGRSHLNIHDSEAVANAVAGNLGPGQQKPPSALTRMATSKMIRRLSNAPVNHTFTNFSSKLQGVVGRLLDGYIVSGPDGDPDDQAGDASSARSRRVRLSWEKSMQERNRERDRDVDIDSSASLGAGPRQPKLFSAVQMLSDPTNRARLLAQLAQSENETQNAAGQGNDSNSSAAAGAVNSGDGTHVSVSISGSTPRDPDFATDGLSPNPTHSVRRPLRFASVSSIMSTALVDTELTPFPSLKWHVFSDAAKAELPAACINAATMLKTAVQFVDVVRRIQHPKTGAPMFTRIGLHTGDVVGGVIGTRSFRYDVWGADVLAANVMESNGVTGGIAISETTYAALMHIQKSRFAIPGLTFNPYKTVSCNLRPQGEMAAWTVSIAGVPLAVGSKE